jgi:SAM-dependent methyltransferase
MTRHVRRELQVLLKDFGVRSILDIPCGDFNWMREMDLAGIDYFGADIVKPLIAKNKEAFENGGVHFEVLDLLTDELPPSDLVICRDCFIHLPLAMISRAIENIRRSKSKWLLASSFPWRGLGPNAEAAVGGFRRINLEMAPFGLPSPVRTIIEGFHPEGTQDKSLVLYDIASIPAQS